MKTHPLLGLLMAALLFPLLVGCGAAAQTAATDKSEEEEALPPREIAIGDYAFRAYDPASNTQTRFDFSLAGLVDEKDVAGLEEEFQKKQIRIRDRVMIVSRESTIEELEDPDLVMFRRRLLKELNRLIDDGKLNEVYVSHFRVKTR
ncbi:flagellar basal body-associated FliL family protein [Blastopirellula marina]|uniref:Flagellar protein FliL n=1 Tax=Blastopirellula marina TaxID=124 RepID=A0A2S8FLC6_9BACT|nr:flagellar basal body-associated FliL family protein [Blastopirellula marina]PQO32961.1 hypothetical protein C5Y98_17640 [Blastopirellula marina]PTL43128.1 hypothetical protein C5Y97_17650 [Blastopirellula marina]